MITKTDMTTEQRAVTLRSALSRLNPTAQIVDVNSDTFDGHDLLMAGASDARTKLAEVRHWLAATGRICRIVSRNIGAIASTSTWATITLSISSHFRCVWRR